MHQAKQVTLVYITDLHHALGGNQLQAAEAVREQAKRLNADAIVCGGDFSENGVKSDVLASQRKSLRRYPSMVVRFCPRKAIMTIIPSMIITGIQAARAI